jgi:hypothetical protein
MMRFKQYASVLDIGRAAVRGESEAFAISLDGFGNIGRTVAESLMQAGVARKVAGDLFTLKPEPSRPSILWGDIPPCPECDAPMEDAKDGWLKCSAGCGCLARVEDIRASRPH